MFSQNKPLTNFHRKSAISKQLVLLKSKFDEKIKSIGTKIRVYKQRDFDVDEHISRSDRNTLRRRKLSEEEENLGHEEGPENELQYEQVEEEIVGNWNPRNPSLSCKQFDLPPCSPTSGYSSHDEVPVPSSRHEQVEAQEDSLNCFETVDVNDKGEICFSRAQIEINEDSSDEIESEQKYGQVPEELECEIIENMDHCEVYLPCEDENADFDENVCEDYTDQVLPTHEYDEEDEMLFADAELIYDDVKNDPLELPSDKNTEQVNDEMQNNKEVKNSKTVNGAVSDIKVVCDDLEQDNKETESINEVKLSSSPEQPLKNDSISELQNKSSSSSNSTGEKVVDCENSEKAEMKTKESVVEVCDDLEQDSKKAENITEDVDQSGQHVKSVDKEVDSKLNNFDSNNKKTDSTENDGSESTELKSKQENCVGHQEKSSALGVVPANEAKQNCESDTVETESLNEVKLSSSLKDDSISELQNESSSSSTSSGEKMVDCENSEKSEMKTKDDHVEATLVDQDHLITKNGEKDAQVDNANSTVKVRPEISKIGSKSEAGDCVVEEKALTEPSTNKKTQSESNKAEISSDMTKEAKQNSTDKIKQSSLQNSVENDNSKSLEVYKPPQQPNISYYNNNVLKPDYSEQWKIYYNAVLLQQFQQQVQFLMHQQFNHLTGMQQNYKFDGPRNNNRSYRRSPSRRRRSPRRGNISLSPINSRRSQRSDSKNRKSQRSKSRRSSRKQQKSVYRARYKRRSSKKPSKHCSRSNSGDSCQSRGRKRKLKSLKRSKSGSRSVNQNVRNELHLHVVHA